LTAGRYVFGVVPSSYPTGDAAKNASRYLDVPTQLLDTAYLHENNHLCWCPWVLEGFMKALKNESDEARKARIMGAIESFKVFGAGGASTSAECIEWAKRVDGFLKLNGKQICPTVPSVSQSKPTPLKLMNINVCVCIPISPDRPIEVCLNNHVSKLNHL
jgi:hypothetical protein